MRRNDHRSRTFLPDFGSGTIAWRLLVLAQVIAIVLTVSRNNQLNQAAWNDFLLMTAFAQLIAVSVIFTLKIISPPLIRMRADVGATIIFIVLMLITAVVIEAAVWGMHQLQITTERWPAWHGSLLVRTLIISAVIYVLVLRYFAVSHRAQMESEAQQRSRLEALQSRIRPHFMFNSLNSVASLIRSDPELAEKALQDLADLFRVLLADPRKMVPITAEGELARQYLDIEKLRLGDRLQVKWTASNVPRSAQIPSLTLQPIIENAVYHGIEPSFAGGTIDIQMWSENNDTLNVMISNPLAEVTNQGQHRRGNQIAMNNVQERLTRHFGGKASLHYFEQLGNYHVKIQMPIIRG